MTTTDYPMDARFRSIEDRLVTIERDLAVLTTHLSHAPTTWNIVALILPLYGFLLLGFAGIFYFLLNYVKVPT